MYVGNMLRYYFVESKMRNLRSSEYFL